jgi:hypothetical protein
MALKTHPVMSDLRAGINVDNTASIMAAEAKFENPHKAYVAIVAVLSYRQKHYDGTFTVEFDVSVIDLNVSVKVYRPSVLSNLLMVVLHSNHFAAIPIFNSHAEKSGMTQ